MERRLAVIFAADVVGYSRLIEEDEGLRSSACGQIVSSCSSRKSNAGARFGSERI